MEYIKGGNQKREEFKNKSPSKVVEVGTSGEDKEASKGKCKYIATITRKEP